MNLEQLFIDGIEDVTVIDVVRYSAGMSVDALLYKYYGGDPVNVNGLDQTLEYLPLLLMFNNIPDLSSLQYGTLIRMPDINSILDSMLSLDLEDSVPGISTTQQSAAGASATAGANATTAAPKLGITLPSVSIDPTTGIITF
jgi:hypothetical protein